MVHLRLNSDYLIKWRHYDVSIIFWCILTRGHSCVLWDTIDFMIQQRKSHDKTKRLYWKNTRETSSHVNNGISYLIFAGEHFRKSRPLKSHDFAVTLTVFSCLSVSQRDTKNLTINRVANWKDTISFYNFICTAEFCANQSIFSKQP